MRLKSIRPPLTQFDAAFGLELTSTEILPPPPKLAFNEVSAASSDQLLAGSDQLRRHRRGTGAAWR